MFFFSLIREQKLRVEGSGEKSLEVTEMDAPEDHSAAHSEERSCKLPFCVLPPVENTRSFPGGLGEERASGEGRTLPDELPNPQLVEQTL